MSEPVEQDSNTQEQPKRKYVRQPPSVPFVWEERPGLPKKDWKPEPAPSSSLLPLGPPLPPPVKLVASVPFTWEETPGKPITCFSDDPPEPSDPSPELMRLPPPPMYAHGYVDDNRADVDNEMDLESFGFDTDDSFSSAPSLLAANCLVSSDGISSAIPVDEFGYLNERMTSLPTSPAYESDSSTSSYMTGSSSLVGASFLEKLFPRLPPDSGLVREAPAVPEDDSVSCALPEVKPKASETNSGFIVRKPPTLGELIMMSRRRSYMRKAVGMRKQNLSMEFTKNGGSSCCLFVPAIKLIEGLELKKFESRLKLI